MKNIYNLIRNDRKLIVILISYLLLVSIGLMLDSPFGLLVLFSLLKIEFLLPLFSKFNFLLVGIFLVVMIILKKYSKKNKLLIWIYNTLFVIYLIISLIIFIFLIVFGNGGRFFE